MLSALFVASKILTFLGAYVAKNTVPYLGFFPYKELLTEYGLPNWIASFANFDGIHYLLIAKQGYSQWEQAFFPLYPLLIRAFSYIISNYLVSALFISNISSFIGFIFLTKLLKKNKVDTLPFAIFLLSFPTAFFFSVVYTEGLFFMFFVLSLYFLEEKKYWLAGVCAALTSMTRLIGIFILVPFLFSLLSDNKLGFKQLFVCIKKNITLLFSPVLGLLSYMVYLYITTGDPLFFFHSQPVFGANRSTNLIILPQVYYRYFKILITATHDFRWYMSLIELGIFSFVFAILFLDLLKIINKIYKSKTKDYFLLGLNIFSFINLILPTLTGTFSSIPRYSLFSLSLFIYIAELKSKALKWGIFFIFVTMQIVLLSLFVQGYFIG